MNTVLEAASTGRGALALESEAMSMAFNPSFFLSKMKQLEMSTGPPASWIFYYLKLNQIWPRKKGMREGDQVESQGNPFLHGLENKRDGQKSQDLGYRGRNNIRNKVECWWGKVFQAWHLPHKSLPLYLFYITCQAKPRQTVRMRGKGKDRS